MFKDKSLHGLFHKLRYVLLKCLGATRCLKRHGYGYCQVQFQLASSVQVQLRTEISLIIISVRPYPIHPSRASIFEALPATLEAEIELKNNQLVN